MNIYNTGVIYFDMKQGLLNKIWKWKYGIVCKIKEEFVYCIEVYVVFGKSQIVCNMNYVLWESNIYL